MTRMSNMISLKCSPTFIKFLMDLPPIKKWSPTLVLKCSSLEIYVDIRVRAGGGELHNISSLMGGLVAQEAIKLITRQYIPSDNTCVFDGITSSTNVWSL